MKIRQLLIALSLFVSPLALAMEQTQDNEMHDKQMRLFNRAMHYIKTNAHEELLDLFFKKSEGINLHFKQYENTSTIGFHLLDAAIEDENFIACNTLLLAGANIHEHASYWHAVTPLSLAIGKCYGEPRNSPSLSICELFLSRGAEITEHCITVVDSPNFWPIAQLIAQHVLTQNNNQKYDQPSFVLKLNNKRIPIYWRNVSHFIDILGKKRERTGDGTKPSAYGGVRSALNNGCDSIFMYNAVIELFTANENPQVWMPSSRMDIQHQIHRKIEQYIEGNVPKKNHYY